MTYQFEFGSRARNKLKERRSLIKAEKDFLKGLGNHMAQIAKRSCFVLPAGRRLILLEKYLENLPGMAQWNEKEK